MDETRVAAGNEKLMKMLGIDCNSCHSTGTIIHIALNGEYAGHIVISDIEKPNSKKAVAALKKAGIDKTVMLTGDAKKLPKRLRQILVLMKCIVSFCLPIRYLRLKG